jgi:virulence-associated protein VagC
MSMSSVFTNNRSQAVRLPADVRLPEGAKKVQVRARGVDRIISPVGRTWDDFFPEWTSGVRGLHGRARQPAAGRTRSLVTNRC